MNLYSKALDNYVVFDGRATRAEFWIFKISNIVIMLILSYISFQMDWTFTDSSETTEYAALGVIFWIFIVIPDLSVTIRRIHDIGLSGWWGWLFIPLLFPLIIVGLIPSKKDKASKKLRASLSKAVANHTKDITNELRPSVERYIEKHIELSNRENEDDTSLDDEILYEYVLLNEIEEDNKVKSTWAKSLAHSDGIDAKAESIYMQYRVQFIKDQLDAQEIAYGKMSKESLFDCIKNDFKDPIEEQRKLEETQLAQKELEELKQQEELEEHEISKLNKEESKIAGYIILFILCIYIVVMAFT